MSRPDYPAAKAAAPEWCRFVLHTLNAQDARIQALEIQLQK
jgi:hypothetical protein